jgi:hypothetical protein
MAGTCSTGENRNAIQSSVRVTPKESNRLEDLTGRIIFKWVLKE